MKSLSKPLVDDKQETSMDIVGCFGSESDGNRGTGFFSQAPSKTSYSSSNFMLKMCDTVINSAAMR